MKSRRRFLILNLAAFGALLLRRLPGPPRDRSPGSTAGLREARWYRKIDRGAPVPERSAERKK